MAVRGEADIFSPVAKQKVTLTARTGCIYRFTLLLLMTINDTSLEDISAEAAANWLTSTTSTSFFPVPSKLKLLSLMVFRGPPCV